MRQTFTPCCTPNNFSTPNNSPCHSSFETRLKLAPYISPTLKADLKEIATQVLCLNFKKHILLISLVGGFSIGAFTGFIEDWIFSPAASLLALLALIFVDHVAGIAVALKHSALDTRKMFSVFWKLLSHVALLMFANNLSKGSVFLAWLNEGIFVPIVLINLLSLIKNLSLLGYIKRDFAKWIDKKIDTYKNESLSSSSGNSDSSAS